MSQYHFRYAISMLAGVVCIAAETNINFHDVYERTSAVGFTEIVSHIAAQPLATAVLIAGIVQAVAVMVVVGAWRARRWSLWLIALCGLAAAVAFTFTTTYKRTSIAQDLLTLERAGINTPQRATAARIKALEADIATECVTIGAECRKLRAELRQEKAGAAGIGEQLNVNPLGQFEIVQRLALPLMLLLLGFAFVAFAEGEPAIATKIIATAAPANDDPLPGKTQPSPHAMPTPAEVEQRRRMIREFEDNYARKHGHMPRHREIMDATGLPKATVSRMRRKAG